LDHKIEYYQIALIQLEKAIKLYLGTVSLEAHICALTLAGAAEGLLGALVKQSGKIHALDSILLELQNEHDIAIEKKALIAELNHGRDALKHVLNFENPILDFIELKPSQDAGSMIMRGIINYKTLTNEITVNMREFAEAYLKEKPAD
jgi:hypothetical protein